MLQNISITCPILSTFVSNCYLVTVRLFILGNKEIKSKEGTTQSDPTVMAAYALRVAPLIHFLHQYVSMNNHRCKEVASADDFTIAGKIAGIRSYWELLQQVGPLYGYFSKPSKSYLLVKEQYLENAVETFRGSEVKITKKGKKHLGAAIGGEDFKASYVKSLADNWIEQLNLLSQIAESEQQSAYSAFVGGFKGKLAYYMRTISSIKDFLMPLEEVIRFKFIPSIHSICSNDERVLLSLPTRLGGLGIPLFHENTGTEFENSRKLTSSLTDLIKNQSVLYSVNGIEQKKIKTTIKTERENIHKNVLNTLQNRLNENQLRLNSINREKGVSSWLTSYPISEHRFDLTKQQFWDSLRLRYGWVLPNMPPT